MKTKTYYVKEICNGYKHEIIIENSVARYYDFFKDGVKEHYIAECLSFEAAFRSYCVRNRMMPISYEEYSNKSCDRLNAARAQNSSKTFPEDLMTTLNCIYGLFKQEIISKDEFESLKTKIIDRFTAKF